MPAYDRPPGWTRLRTWQHLQRCAEAGGLIVIVDEPTDRARGGPRFHHPGCRHVSEHHFETKRGNGWANGAYYWVADEALVRGHAVPCGDCEGRTPS